MDTHAANIMLKLKSNYSMITLECTIPCETQSVKWNERDIYYDLLSKSDKQTLLQQKYNSDCMKKETNIRSTTLTMLLQHGMEK